MGIMETMDNFINIFFDNSIEMLLVIFELFLLILYQSYKFYKVYKLSKRLYQTPFYNRALEGIYVKFIGKVAKLNQLKTPIFNTKCEFYHFVIKGVLQVKRKKPHKSYKFVTKTLNQEISSEFLLQNNTQEIYVKPDKKNLKNSTKYKIRDESKRTTTALKKEFIFDKKYKKYLYRSLFLQEGDIVTVYGRLIKKDNKFIITDTYNKKLPFIIFRGDYTSFGKFYNKSFFYRLFMIIFYLFLLSNLEMIRGVEILFLILFVVFNFFLESIGSMIKNRLSMV